MIILKVIIMFLILYQKIFIKIDKISCYIMEQINEHLNFFFSHKILLLLLKNYILNQKKRFAF